MHGSTYGGGPLACRVALEFFDILEGLLPSINAVGGYFRMRLTELMRTFSFIKEVRGHGLMIGVELEYSGQAIVLDGIGKACSSIARTIRCCDFCRLIFHRTGRGPGDYGTSQGV